MEVWPSIWPNSVPSTKVTVSSKLQIHAIHEAFEHKLSQTAKQLQTIPPQEEQIHHKMFIRRMRLTSKC